MPTIKIVPMPGVSVPGPQGPRGYQGETGLAGPQGPAGADAVFPEPVEWTPVLSNNGFVQSSNISHGHYYKYGRMTVVNLNVPFSNVTNFGTGQYSLTLPFAAATHMDIFGGTLHDTSTNSFYTIKGHVEANSNVMTLWYLSVVTKDAEFDHNSPFELDTTDLFHMNFIYETVA